MTTIRRVSTGKRTALVVALVVALVLALGGVMAAASAAAKPPAPSISSSPSNPTTATSASFAFGDSQSGVTFKCSRDGAAFVSCSSGVSYSGLAQGNHTFRVEAVSGSSTSNATSFSWAIVPPTPTIVTHPTNPTGATSAAFTYTDTQSGVGFRCSLDGSSFNTCFSAGITYSGLVGGSHGFRVEAQVGSNPPSSPASFTWVIDKTAPTITIVFPVDGGAYNAAGWAAGCSPVGVCGAAADPAGVQSVAVAIRQQSSGKYWNGSSFSSSSIVFNTATGTTTWHYAIARPADGKYTESVRATDTFGNTTANSSLTTATFTIDTVPPAAPALTDKPSNPSKDKSPEFEFTDTSSSVTFTCRLDSGTPVPCTGDTDHDGDNNNNNNGDHGHDGDNLAHGEIQYGALAAGPHCFYVFATDPAGNISPTTTFCWTITGTVAATTITVNSGSPQVVDAHANFAPLTAKVTGAGNVPVAGVQVTFSAPASGASGAFASCSGGNPHPYSCVVTTDINGLATASTFTANGTAGGYTVTATATGVVTPANFSLFNSMNFTISGGLPLTQPLFPGTSQPLNLKFTNPNPSPITIVGTVGSPALGISVSTGTLSCLASNFSTRGLITTITIPANANAVSLSDLGVSSANWPILSMIETHTIQDGCQHLTLTLTYTGSATG